MTWYDKISRDFELFNQDLERELRRRQAKRYKKAEERKKRHGQKNERQSR